MQSHISTINLLKVLYQKKKKMFKPFKKQNALILIYHNDNKNSPDTFPLIRVRYSQVSLINRESLDIVRPYYRTLIAMFGGI